MEPEGGRTRSTWMDSAEVPGRPSLADDLARLDGYLFVAPGEPADELDRELEAARRAGLEVEMVARAPLGSFDTGRALRFRRQGQFHPLRYLAGLARAILAGGGQIYS